MSQDVTCEIKSRVQVKLSKSEYISKFLFIEIVVIHLFTCNFVFMNADVLLYHRWMTELILLWKKKQKEYNESYKLAIAMQF